MKRRNVQAAVRDVESERDRREPGMTAALIMVLVAVCGYLGMRLFSAVSEISTLRTHVASLKRQLQQR
jgi:hypothetical protein